MSVEREGRSVNNREDEGKETTTDNDSSAGGRKRRCSGLSVRPCEAGRRVRAKKGTGEKLTQTDLSRSHLIDLLPLIPSSSVPLTDGDAITYTISSQSSPSYSSTVSSPPFLTMRSFPLLVALGALLALSVWSPSASFLVLADDVDSSSLPTYYDLLELPTTSSLAEVKRSFRRLALLHHPDKATSPSDRSLKEAAFIELSDAYEVLSSPTLRPRYDYLLSQHIHRYSDTVRDWTAFNADTGKFDGAKKGEVVFGDGRFSFSGSRSWEDAKERWEREKGEEDREKRALIMALVGSAAIALLPVAWFYAQRGKTWWAQQKRKGEASEKLRGEQVALQEYHEEMKREEVRRKGEARARAAEIRRLREEAAAEAEAEDEDEDTEVEGAPLTSNPESANGVVGEGSAVDPSQPLTAAVPTSVDVEEVEEEEDDRPRKGEGSGGGVFSCAVCRKKFKSQKQLDNHLVSNAHKKAVKDWEAQQRKGAKQKK